VNDAEKTPDENAPDPGVALSIRMPLVLGPDERNPGGIVVRGWAGDTGERIIGENLTLDQIDGNDPSWPMLIKKLDRPIPSILMCAYDGDDGTILTTSLINPGYGDEDDDDDMPVHLTAALSDATADPNEPCVLCDETIANGETFDRSTVHRECLLANIIGPLGHHLDHDFWCINMADSHCGLGVRLANLDLAALVDRHGLEAVMKGDFPKDEVPTAGRRDAR
jgi:hypothetical protein